MAVSMVQPIKFIMDNMTIQQLQSLSDNIIIKVIKKALGDKADIAIVKDILSGYEKNKIAEEGILTVKKL